MDFHGPISFSPPYPRLTASAVQGGNGDIGSGGATPKSHEFLSWKHRGTGVLNNHEN